MTAETDSDWHRATHSFFSAPLTSQKPFTPTLSQLTEFRAAAVAQNLLPFEPFDISTAYMNCRNNDHPARSSHMDFPRIKALHLNAKVVRRILAARESIFKYGIYLSHNDRDADASPERARWHSGRQLEWIRLKDVDAFEYGWTKDRLFREYPSYLPSNIGHLFYIYDYKFSGEHHVHLVFDGSRQSPNTYDDTNSPTVHPDSIRMFHV